MLVYMKHSYYRFAFVLLGAIVVLFVGAMIFAMYAEGHRAVTPSAVEKVEEALQEENRVVEDVVALDTNGSSTPQGTLGLFIAAVENHNDREAVAYFVVDAQQRERERLAGFSESTRAHVVDLLRKAMNATGTYSQAGDLYTIRTPVLVDCIRYPNGTWKLIEL